MKEVFFGLHCIVGTKCRMTGVFCETCECALQNQKRQFSIGSKGISIVLMGVLLLNDIIRDKVQGFGLANRIDMGNFVSISNAIELNILIRISIIKETLPYLQLRAIRDGK